jgi:hypothetical protein
MFMKHSFIVVKLHHTFYHKNKYSLNNEETNRENKIIVFGFNYIKLITFNLSTLNLFRTWKI